MVVLTVEYWVGKLVDARVASTVVMSVVMMDERKAVLMVDLMVD